ncbi:MAG: peptide ABC transporter permease [Candidatus Chloroheliales bacterium]|nr:MAG: peptide ABC transporter permease [Chloroflexota bacterium]
MLQYIIRRIIGLFFVLIGIALLTFLLMHLAKGSPFAGEGNVPPNVIASINASYGLDKPLPIQFITTVWNFLHGDFGVSYKQQVGRPVWDIMMDGFGNSAVLGACAFAFTIFVGILLGLLAAIGQNTWLDYTTMTVSLAGYSIPNFVLGALLLLLAATVLNPLLPANLQLPIGGWINNAGPGAIILPTFVLALRPTSILARLTRASMLEVVRQDYIRTAWAKGLGQRVVIIRHALRNAMLPVVTVLGDELGNLITGSIVIEQLFVINGLGQQFVRSVRDLDYNIIMGTTIFYAFIVVLINLAVDILYAFIDPRISYTKARA